MSDKSILSEEQKRVLRRDGFVLVPGVFGAAFPPEIERETGKAYVFRV